MAGPFSPPQQKPVKWGELDTIFVQLTSNKRPPFSDRKEFQDKTDIFRKGGLQLSKNTTFMQKFGGPIKWEPFWAVLAGNFAPEVVLKASFLISKQTALFFPIADLQFKTF